MQGNFIENSSHFLTNITLLVLPVNNRSSIVDENTLNIRGCWRKNRQINLFETKLVKKMKQTNTQIKNQRIRKSNKDNNNNNQIILGGFRLSINQHYVQKYNKKFYCGQCNRAFKNGEQFIVHSIQVCQSLHNQYSSHYITCTLDENVTSNKQKSRKKRIQIHPQTFIMKNLYYKILKEKNLEPKYCKICNIDLPNNSHFFYHIVYNHSQIVDSRISHIVIRVEVVRSQFSHIYISTKMEWPTEEPIYECPCKFGNKMSMNKLTKHILNIHKGISPFYLIKY